MMSHFIETFPDSLDLRPVSRRPTTLSAETVRSVLERPVPHANSRSAAEIESCRKDGLTSIVVVTFNGLVFTRLCLESLLANTADADYELIVVDNGSTDGTVQYLQLLGSRDPRMRLILNARNLGFAAATNQAVERAAGSRIVLLNNDTVVSPRWLGRLLGHLDKPGAGIVSPVTNRSGNESEIDVSYRTYGSFLRFAEHRHAAYRRTSSEMSSLVMFCAALRRAVWDEIGSLDERFEIGMFEDDDYAMRLRSAGLRLVCAEDTFIHHFGQATIGKLAQTEEYGQRFHANRERWEKKWARTWEPHRRRPDPAYERLVQRIRSSVRSTLPENAEIAVVSNGDDELIDLAPCHGMHFPRGADGAYAGYHPRDSRDAIACLESVREQGAEYLVVPTTASWWLEHYSDLRRHLEREHRLLSHDPDTCAVFALSPAVDVPDSRKEIFGA